MKPNTFKYSLLTAGVVAAMGVSSMASAASTTRTNDTFDITNQATATYNVGGTSQPTVTSNEVKVTVSQQINFSLTDDRTGTITPDGTVVFNHTLTNDGNTLDKYTLNVADVTTGDNFDYKGGFTIEVSTDNGTTYKTYNSTNFPNGVVLDGGASAQIRITAVADDSDTVVAPNSKGETGQLTLTATSSLLPAGSNALTNTDTATTVTPTFAIQKSANVTTIQQNSTGTITYTITVKNDGSMNATDVDIVDLLPTNLQFATNKNLVVKKGTTALTAGTDYVDSSDATKIAINNVDIAKNETITITFDTTLKSGVALGTEITNNVTVKDDPDDDANTNNTITDTANKAESANNTNDTADTNDSGQPVITVINREVTITQNETITLPETGSYMFTHTITNNGTVDETALTLSQNLTTNDTTITQTFYLDTNGDGVYTAGTDQAYTLGDTLPTLKPTGQSGNSIKVFVINTATNATAGNDTATSWDDNTEITREVYELAVGGTANTTPKVTDTIKIAGLELKKEQFVDANCTGTGTYSTTNVSNANPNECIYYRISAINHLPTTNPATTPNLQDITKLVISDSIAQIGTTLGKVTYQNDAAGTIDGSTGGSVTYSAPLVKDTINTLGAGKTATLTFSVKINP